MSHELKPADVFPALRRYLLADGLEVVLDLERSHGSWLRDALSGEEFLDFFTCFASWPIGYRHELLETAEFRDQILEAATHNPSNSDLYTVAMAEFVKEFGEHALPPTHRHLFLVTGGALAVENALKAAFDWKVRLNQQRKTPPVREADGSARADVGWQVIHFKEAFHGRSGYTLSLTNTADPRKTMYFPKFRWPRVACAKMRFPMEGENAAATLRDEEQSIREIEAAFAAHGADVAALILEPIQCEGGDNHFRPEFLRRVRELCTKHDAMLVFDEVQTGFYGTGKPWCFQHLGVEPDLVAFGKKTQICGFFANARIESIERNVFVEGSRINSTWGGNLADMTRSKWVHRAIRRDAMAENATAMGELLVARLREMGLRMSGGWLGNARGRGALVAFDCPSKESRDALLKRCFARRLLVLACGERSIRFRPPLNLSKPELDRGLDLLATALDDLGVRAGASVASADQASRVRAQKDAPGSALECAK